MDRTIKTLLVILFVLLGLGGFFAYTLVSAVQRAGSIHVAVHPKSGGPSFVLPVPAAFINAFADAATIKNVDCDGELEAWRPALRAAIDDFDRYPDMTFIEVDHEDESIRVRKVAGQLVIDVDSDDAFVNVSVPPATVRKFIDAMTSVHVDRDRDWSVEVSGGEMDI